MTVIAYKDGLLASDSAISSDIVYIASMKKVIRTSAGWLVGGCGDVVHVVRFLSWAEAGFKARSRPPPSEDFAGMAIAPDGSLSLFEKDMMAFPVSAPFLAIGSGADLALGAMAHGASAAQAVEIAIQFCHGCKGPVQVCSLAE